MIRLRTKLSLFNLLTRLIVMALFIILMPFIIGRINLRQVDFNLIEKRERMISLISETGIEPFIISDTSNAFGSYNILKEEFISLEKIDTAEDLNYIEVSPRLIDGEEIVYRVLNYSFDVDDQKYLLAVGKSIQSIVDTGKDIRNVMLIFLILIILINFIADYQYTRIILDPLEKIRNKLKLVSDPALFDMTPVRTNTSDFIELDKTLCALMDNINQLFRKEKDITVNISHELLTPVSVLRSKLENILLIKDLDNDVEARIEESLKTLHRLQSLINSLLMIAKIESHQYLREDSFSVKEVIEEVADEIEPLSEDAGIMLIKEFKDDISIEKANRSLIFSMFFNIVNNSVRNTPAGGRIIIESRKQNKDFSVMISDTGKGLTGEQKELLFSRFRMRNKESGEGTGIGLAIAKTIADFHQIDISVDSDQGKGTKFTFLFPGKSTF
ncbi:MAG TPA: HAMP domain-containing sensor histidine kinase [Bacteroidales bacterium]|nr:HAMP domain-containing sensor histidine kinase [Bacteroidales bacterium]HOX73947.1 HAMP domain-containing sensor histidine kinase [Bacteroidales bacterium]HQM70556.1 HAMP domain-containing sensor histidine kinase [Bacteroidales bacterium]